MTYPYQFVFECAVCWWPYDTVACADFCAESHHD